MGSPSSDSLADANVVQRLQIRLDQARQIGMTVRIELLDDQQPSWCILAGKPTLFVDLSQTAVEQLHQLDEAIVEYQQYAAENAITATSGKAA